MGDFSFINTPAAHSAALSSFPWWHGTCRAKLAMMKPLDPNTNVRLTLLVDAPPNAVWKALTDPALARLYMGSTMCCELRTGQPIQWFTREEDGTQRLTAKGMVMAVQPGERLRYTTYTPGGKLPDVPASHTTVDIHLIAEDGERTRVELWQGDFAGLPQEVRRARAAERLWVERLVGLKRTAEETWQAMAA
jgi:uncharacterized protein YndB with AHSA1/START domain